MTPAGRHLLLDEVIEARSTQAGPMHAFYVVNTAARLVRALYAAQGWWEVKPRHWLSDLQRRDSQAARHLQTALNGANSDVRQAALEALALGVLDNLTYGESATEPQHVP